MANKAQKTNQKALSSEIVRSIETALGETGDAAKKIKKSVEKSADKLAKKLTKLLHKVEKKDSVPTKKAKKQADKIKKADKQAKHKADKGSKSIHSDSLINAAPETNTSSGSLTIAPTNTSSIKTVPVRPKTAPKPAPAPAPEPIDSAVEGV